MLVGADFDAGIHTELRAAHERTKRKLAWSFVYMLLATSQKEKVNVITQYVS